MPAGLGSAAAGDAAVAAALLSLLALSGVFGVDSAIRSDSPKHKKKERKGSEEKVQARHVSAPCTSAPRSEIYNIPALEEMKL